ncbi:MAG TPA: S8 family serine peptidase [Sporichthyaceae bacterium]|jgi:subtilisin family serine protease|nr:S8 family serine peptidase [Sporichthyaceae bacterium]
MATRSKAGEGSATAETTVGASRERTFLIARQEPFVNVGPPPVDLDALLAALEADPAISVERVLTARGHANGLTPPIPLQKIIVARMPEERAHALARLPHVLIEEDAAIHPMVTVWPAPAGTTDPAAFLPFGQATTWQFAVLSDGDAPVVGAAVFLYGSGVPGQGRTDESGTVSISLPNESDDTIRALYVNPPSGHWDLWVDDPALTSRARNVVRLEAFGPDIVGAAKTPRLGWGQRAMRLDELDPAVTGVGIKIAVVDSGINNAHPDLARVSGGEDLLANPTGWEHDTISHGTHCAGIIGGRPGAGLRGFSPGAEVIALRVLPGGRFSTLLAALDHCIEAEVDVVNLSLGSTSASTLVLGKLAQAKAAGVACVVAAGNTGGPVQFPGLSRDVLTVAAVGRVGEFPATSRHARQVPFQVDPFTGWFRAAFSCQGPEVDLCAPGVGIVSTVGTDGFAAWDGTGAAAAHVSGLAALVLAHHPDFTGPFRARNAARVERLFGILRASATPLDLGVRGGCGAGLPDAVRALQPGLPVDRAGVNAPQTGSPWAVIEQLRREFVNAGLLLA